MHECTSAGDVKRAKRLSSTIPYVTRRGTCRGVLLNLKAIRPPRSELSPVQQTGNLHALVLAANKSQEQQYKHEVRLLESPTETVVTFSRFVLPIARTRNHQPLAPFTILYSYTDQAPILLSASLVKGLEK